MERLRKEPTNYASLLPIDLSRKIDTELINFRNKDLYRYILDNWLIENNDNLLFSEKDLIEIVDQLSSKYNIKISLEIIGYGHSLKISKASVVSEDAVVNLLKYVLKYGKSPDIIELNNKFASLQSNIRIIQLLDRQEWIKEKLKDPVYEIAHINLITKITR